MCTHCWNINSTQWWASSVAQSQLFFRLGLCTLTFVSIYDAKGSHSVKACVVLMLSYIMYSLFKLCTCAQTRQKAVRDCVTEEYYHCVVVLKQGVRVHVDV
jgi:hypothetical protein